MENQLSVLRQTKKVLGSLWHLAGSVTVKRSDEALKIRCKDGDEYVTRSVTPNKDEMIWGNVIFGGIIGGAVDANSDAHWELPETVLIHRENCD